MTRNRNRALLGGVLAAVLAASSPALAQDWIDPAAAVRVVESRDPVSGEIARWVVESPTPAEVLRIQIELARSGFDPGVRTGMLDGATRAALSDFQTARGIVICGCLTYETIIALGIRPDVVDFVQAPGARDDAYADGSSYDVRYDRYGDVIVVLPFKHFGDPFHKRRKHRRPRSGVIVGHEPALGTGQLGGVPVTVGVRGIVPPAPRSRPGSSIRPGRAIISSGPPSRPSRPRP